jgi:uncharacterized membrane protein
MLSHATTGLTVVIIFFNLVGLALIGQRLTGSYILSRATTPVAVALILFFCEHFVGLGRIAWCWPIVTLASAWIISRDFGTLRAHLRVEAVFLAAFAWAFAWRFSYPGLVASSEKLGDLAMISSYLPGTRLPPQDVWLPPFPFDVYYSFQHYAAALLGRIFGLGPGETYNMAFCLVIALTILCAAACAHLVCRKATAAALVVVAFAVGGTGASLPVHLMMRNPELHSSMRFIGGAFVAAPAMPFAVAKGSRTAGTEPLELPSETFAYLTSVGDYHPPLSGFYLLMLALLCLALVESGVESRFAQAVLAASIVLCAIANGWTAPLQAVLVSTWIAYRLWHGRPPDWKWLASGFFVAAGLCYPFLQGFALRSVDYNLTLRHVAANLHTPPILGLIVLYPILAAVIVPLIFGERKHWILWSSLMWLLLLVFSELFYVDDIYSGRFERFNTTLKWWPWIQAGALLLGGAYGLESASRACRYITMIVLSVVSLYGVDLGRALVTGNKVDFGRIDGAAWITSDKIERSILEFLKAQPPGIALQRLEAGAFTPAPGLVIFAGHRAFLGWPEHEKLWRGQRADITTREADVKTFYAAEMANAADWLLQNDISHVLWLKTEDKLPLGTFDKLDAQIRSAYFWREYYRAGYFRVGIWCRRISVPCGSRPELGSFPRVNEEDSRDRDGVVGPWRASISTHAGGRHSGRC